MSRNTLRNNTWEQWTLPRTLKKKGNPLLLNFCNTAPVNYHNQIITLHDAAVFRNPEWFSKSFATWYHWLWPRIIKNSRHIVTVSEFSRSELISIFNLPASRVSVIHSGIDDALVQGTPSKPKGLNDETFLLMVGGPNPRKNISWTAQALDQFLSDSNMKLIVAGSSNNVFSSSSPAMPNTLFVDHVTDAELAWLYQHCECLIHSSLYEGFSLVPLEAQCFGARTLLSDIPVHREIHEERSSFFALGNPADLQKKLTEGLATAKPKPLSVVDSPYSLRKAAANWQEIIHQLEE